VPTVILPARIVAPVDTLLDIVTPSGFVATCTIADAVGDPVIVSAPDTVTSFATNVYADLCVGIIFEKPTDTTCVVVIGGIVRAITTGLVANKAVFVSTTGALTTTKPATGHLQIMGTALTTTDMVVNVAQNKVIQA
jgi:hypothetical protein